MMVAKTTREQSVCSVSANKTTFSTSVYLTVCHLQHGRATNVTSNVFPDKYNKRQEKVIVSKVPVSIFFVVLDCLSLGTGPSAIRCVFPMLLLLSVTCFVQDFFGTCDMHREGGKRRI